MCNTNNHLLAAGFALIAIMMIALTGLPPFFDGPLTAEITFSEMRR